MSKLSVIRKYVNKISNNILIVDESDIKEQVKLYEVLKVPIGCNSITDKRIEYIESSIQDKVGLKGFIFIQDVDLPKNIKSLFKTYYGCLAIYLDDSQCYESDEKDTEIDYLEDEFMWSLKKATRIDSYLTKATYQGVTLYDPTVPQQKAKWHWVDSYELQKS